MEKVKTMKTYPPLEVAGKVLEDTYGLIEETLDGGCFPYNRFPPRSENRDVMSGHSLGTIQAVQMEMESAKAGSQNQDWIFGTTAAALLLEMKDGASSKPMIFYGIQGGKAVAQYAYPMSCFTEESVVRAVNLGKESTDPYVVAASQNLALRLSGNGSSEQDVSLRKAIRKNAKESLSKDSKQHAQVLRTYKELTGNLSPEEKKAFDTVYNYCALRNGSIRTQPEPNKIFGDESFRSLVKTQGGKNRLVRLILKAQAFAERLTHWGFSHEPVFTEEQAYNKDRLTWSLPEAAKNFYKEKEHARMAAYDRKPERPQHQRTRVHDVGMSR